MTVEFSPPKASDRANLAHGTTGTQPSRRVLRLRLHLSLLMLDVACITVSFLIAAFIYPARPEHQWMTISFTIVPVYLLCAFGGRAYSVEVIQSVSTAVGRGLRAFVVAALAVLFVAFYLKSSEQISRVLFAIGSASSLAILAAARAYFIHGTRSILGGNPYTVVLITEDGAAMRPGEFSVIIPSSAFDPESQDPAMYDRLASALQHADRVVVSCAPERRLAWVHALQGANVVAEILAPELAEMGPMMIGRAASMPTLVVARGPLSFPDRLLKRGFDIAVASGLLLLLAPLMVLTAIAIKLESRGPVFFVQTRIGRANQQFRMFKFRSMRADQSDGHGHRSTGQNDDRVTAVGRLIRRTSIDELPQLLNVFRGEMSIVGPRPHALGSRARDKLFWEIDERYWHRHAAKPGLTGLAQVRGHRGATNEHIDLVNRLHADLEYLDNWSIWRDIKIIIMTFGVLMHDNAF
jgi:exopolysaccharide biosynthesis polyprenyl glycosylphosphotransferase